MGRKRLNINPECGKRLNFWLKTNKYTAQNVAEAIHYTPQHLSGVVNGKKRMTQELAEALENWSKEKQVKDSRTEDGWYILQEDKTVRAQWLLCQDDYINESEIMEQEDKEDAKEDLRTRVLYELLLDGFAASGYKLKFTEYDPNPDGLIIMPKYYNGFYDVINKDDDSVEATFTGAILEQVIDEYMLYSKHMAECIINRYCQISLENAAEDDKRMEQKKTSIIDKEANHGEPTGKKE